jgi:hypothetical protein
MEAEVNERDLVDRTVPRTPKFSQLRLLATWVYTSKREAVLAAEGVRREKPNETVRVFERDVRAGGSTTTVYVVVIRAKR